MGITTETPSKRADNRYRFHCPVVGSEQFFLMCILRRDKHWRGEPIDRPDCATCMNANKCPAVHMLKKEWRAEDGPKAFFFDPSPDRLHQLHRDIWERVKPVCVVPSHGYGTGISAEALSRLCEEKVSVPTSLAVPPAPRNGTPAPALKTPKASPRRSVAAGDLSGALDHVTDMAGHLSATE